MAAAEFKRYALDPTGKSSDNLVAGEVRELTPGAMRAVAPKYGPFFTESMVIYDNGTNRLLIRGVDYELVDLVQEATLKYGQEIMAAILIKNTAVTSQVRITYQVLGGLYQNNSEGIIELYNALMGDARGVDWSKVFNKPKDYPPAPHMHDLMNIHGFGPLVVALERVRDAIVLSNIPAFEDLVSWVKAYSGGSVFFDPVVTSLRKNSIQKFNIQSSNKPNGTVFYWTIESAIEDESFAEKSGSFTLFQNRGEFQIKLGSKAPVQNKPFNIAIRQDSVNGPILSTIEGIVYIGENPMTPGGEQTVMDLFMECCLLEPTVNINAMSMYIIGGR